MHLIDLLRIFFSVYNTRKSNAREADAQTGVSWREIEVKAEQVDTLMDFVTHVPSGYFRGNDERVCARNRDFARYGTSHRSLSAKGHADAACDAYPRGMESVGSWGRKRERETARKRERETAHIDIYFADPRAFAERHSFRDGVASGAFAAHRARDKLRERCPRMYLRRRYIRDRCAKRTAVKVPRAHWAQKRLLRLKFLRTRRYTATTRRPTSRFSFVSITSWYPVARKCVLPYFTLSLSSKIYFAYQNWKCRILQGSCT